MFANFSGSIFFSESSSAVRSDTARRRRPARLHLHNGRRLPARLWYLSPVKPRMRAVAKFRSGVPARVSVLFILAKFLAVILATIPVSSRHTFAAEPPAPGVAQEECLKDPTVIAELIKQLGDDKFEVREAATRELMKSGREAIGPLRKARWQTDREVAIRATKILDVVEPPIVESALQKLSLLNREGEIHLEANGIAVRVFNLQLEKPLDFAPIADLRGLIDFDVDRSNFTDEVLTHIRGLSELNIVQVTSTALTDDCFSSFENLYQLEYLAVRSDHVTGRGLKHLQSLPRLKSLCLKGESLNDEDLGKIGSLKNLQFVYINGKNVTNKVIKSLAGLRKLTALDLSRTSVDDDGMSQLLAFHNLNSLSINDTSISDQGLLNLAKLNSLVAIRLNGTQITKAGLDTLSTFPHLSVIGCERNGIAETEAVELLKRMPNLRSFLVGTAESVTAINRSPRDGTISIFTHKP